jgi:hypothetical protein
MVKLAEIQKKTDELSPEDREGLLAYLLHSLDGVPEGISDDEVKQRDSELESGSVQPVNHGDFVAQVRPDRQ